MATTFRHPIDAASQRIHQLNDRHRADAEQHRVAVDTLFPAGCGTDRRNNDGANTIATTLRSPHRMAAQQRTMRHRLKPRRINDRCRRTLDHRRDLDARFTQRSDRRQRLGRCAKHDRAPHIQRTETF